MKKFIAENYYKICIFFISLYIVLCFITNGIIKLLLFIILIVLFLYINKLHAKIYEDINKIFLWEKYFIEDKNKEYLTSEEEDTLYDKIFNDYFQK